jgi:hypothetical protein
MKRVLGAVFGFVFFTHSLFIFAEALDRHRPLKVLHMALHKGCINDFAEVARELSLDLTSWFIQDDPVRFDKHARGNAIYNIGHDRAKRVWENNKDYFNQFDVIVTSDPAPRWGSTVALTARLIKLSQTGLIVMSTEAIQLLKINPQKNIIFFIVFPIFF